MDIQAKVQEILEANGLNFSIVKVPLVAQLENGRTINENMDVVPNIEVLPTDYFGLYNDKIGQVIHTVKGGYTVSQNSDVVEMVLRGAEPFGNLEVTKGGSLNDGRKIFLQLEVSGYGIVGNDHIKRYITILDSNDGSTGLSVGIGNLTLSCSNQFYKFYKAGTMKARHTVSIEQKIAELPMLIENALSETMRIVKLFNAFQSTACSRELAKGLVNHLLNVDDKTPSDEITTYNQNRMDELHANISSEMDDKGENIWGLFSGVTKWTTHSKKAPKRENGRIESMLIGANYKINQKALDYCLELIY